MLDEQERESLLESYHQKSFDKMSVEEHSELVQAFEGYDIKRASEMPSNLHTNRSGRLNKYNTNDPQEVIHNEYLIVITNMVRDYNDGKLKIEDKDLARLYTIVRAVPGVQYQTSKDEEKHQEVKKLGKEWGSYKGDDKDERDAILKQSEVLEKGLRGKRIIDIAKKKLEARIQALIKNNFKGIDNKDLESFRDIPNFDYKPFLGKRRTLAEIIEEKLPSTPTTTEKVSELDNVVEAAPEITPEVTPEIIAEAAPEITPEVTPEIIAEAAPEITPEIIPEMTFDTASPAGEPDNGLQQKFEALDENLKAYLKQNNISPEAFFANPNAESKFKEEFEKSQKSDSVIEVNQEEKETKPVIEPEKKEIPAWAEANNDAYEKAANPAVANGKAGKSFEIENINFEDGSFAKKFTRRDNANEGLVVRMNKENPTQLSVRGTNEDDIPSIEAFRIIARAEKIKAQAKGETPNINLGQIRDAEFKGRLMVAMLEEGVKINNMVTMGDLSKAEKDTIGMSEDTKKRLETFKTKDEFNLAMARIQELRGLAVGRSLAKLNQNDLEKFKQNVSTNTNADEELKALQNSMLPSERFEKLIDTEKVAAKALDERIKANLGDQATPEEIKSQKQLMLNFYGLDEENRKAFYDYGTDKEDSNEKLNKFKEANEKVEGNSARNAILAARGIIHEDRKNPAAKPDKAKQQAAQKVIKDRVLSAQWGGRA